MQATIEIQNQHDSMRNKPLELLGYCPVNFGLQIHIRFDYIITYLDPLLHVAVPQKTFGESARHGCFCEQRVYSFHANSSLTRPHASCDYFFIVSVALLLTLPGKPHSINTIALIYTVSLARAMPLLHS